MISKLFHVSRNASAGSGQSDSDAGGIVFLMMAVVFLPIILAHAAVMWPSGLGAQQLAAAVNVLLKTF